MAFMVDYVKNITKHSKFFKIFTNSYDGVINPAFLIQKKFTLFNPTYFFIYPFKFS